MPLTQEQKANFDQGAYGMDRTELAEMIDNMIGPDKMKALSLLSDAQHTLEFGDADRARQIINMAKWLIDEKLQEKRSSLDPLI